MELLGMELPKGKALMWVIGGGAVIGLLLAARRASGGGGAAPVVVAGGPDYQGAAEFAAIQAQASSDLAALQIGARMQEKELEYGYALQRQDRQLAFEQLKLSGKAALADIDARKALDRYLSDPTYGRTEVPWSDWTGNPKLQKLVQRQIRNGKLVAQAGPGGVYITPTQAGYAGHQPFVTVDSSQGFFGSGQTVRGPAGSFNPGSIAPPGAPVLSQALSIFAGVAPYLFGGGYGPATGGYRPRSPYYYA